VKTHLWTCEVLKSDRWMTVAWAHRVSAVDALKAACDLTLKGHGARVRRV
jgi:hypothetical protein